MARFFADGDELLCRKDLMKLFHIERVNKTVKAQTIQYPIVAPTVEGYQFLFWLSSATVNWIGSTYIDDPTYYSPSIWIAYPQSSNLLANGTNIVRGFAVYIKNSVAQQKGQIISKETLVYEERWCIPSTDFCCQLERRTMFGSNQSRPPPQWYNER